MYLQIYPYKIDENLVDYYFTSVGPNGNIRKKVTFLPHNMYNLGFGDVGQVADADQAREFLKKYPIPEEILKRAQSND